MSCKGCIVCPTEVRGIYEVAFNLLNLVKGEDFERLAKKLPERLQELQSAVNGLQPYIDAHFDSPSLVQSDAVPNGCLKCGALSGHSVTCEAQSEGDLRTQLTLYYAKWLEGRSKGRGVRDRLCKQIVFWQGKAAALKHENNQLRKKLKTK